ncbi:hypothetical protein SKAU_G00054370 [Synaphobranchus kaupii]|uniref:Uncharacterized protein n=1 Tax=Synaphobranchus kaupii TaxID=118154 RepID=A0A9Q1G3N2_SYNKA|nr:hypothetical protein SKAU_G00054370 [Synaphobranchus kaupii]
MGIDLRHLLPLKHFHLTTPVFRSLPASERLGTQKFHKALIDECNLPTAQRQTGQCDGDNSKLQRRK